MANGQEEQPKPKPLKGKGNSLKRRKWIRELLLDLHVVSKGKEENGKMTKCRNKHGGI